MGKRIVVPCLFAAALLTGSCTYYSDAQKARAEAEAARLEAEMARARADEEAARARAQEAALKAELVRARLAAGPQKEEPEKPVGNGLPPYPTEADTRASLRSLLSEAKVNAEIATFKRTDWSLISEQKYYGVAYEAELAFQGDCQIKENMALMWSDRNSAVGWGGAMSVHAVGTFKKGDRKKLRGHIGYVLREGRWKLDPSASIDVGK